MNSTETSPSPQASNNAQPEDFDLVILGGGTGSTVAAWTFAGEGKRVAVVDRKYIGGSCPNIACLPSKNVIHSAKVADFTKRAGEFGITTGPVTIEMTGVRARKRKMVESEIQHHLDRYKASGAQLIMGEARFIAPKTVEVKMKNDGVRRLAGDQVFLNVGTHAAIPDIPGLRAVNPLTHIQALELDHVPEHLVVLGGGFIGLEMAQAMRRFGSRVTVLERGPQLLTSEDADVLGVANATHKSLSLVLRSRQNGS